MPPLPVALLLAIVQGLTEFLPVSSDGHLALLQNTILPGGNYLFFDVVVHTGTLGALLWYFRRDLWQLARGFLRPGTGDGGSPYFGCERRTVALLCVTTAITAAIGFAVRHRAEEAFRSLLAVAIGFAVTTAYLVASRLARRTARGPRETTFLRAAIVGVLQAVAVFPGVSRSAGTISGGLLLGMRPDFAARYSFLAGIPAIGGAFLLHLLELRGGFAEQPWGLLALAAALSGVVGYLAIALLMRVVVTGALHRFAWYEAAITTLTLVLALTGWH